MTASLNEVRVKLHIIKSNETSVNNTWMCLNYSQKPTIAHIIEHLKANYAANDAQLDDDMQLKQREMINEHLVKLYLDDYWLPPNENSRLIRENDCIKVEIKEIENLKNIKHKEHRHEEKCAASSSNQSKKSAPLDNTSTHDQHDQFYVNPNYSYPNYTQTDAYPVKDSNKNSSMAAVRNGANTNVPKQNGAKKQPSPASSKQQKQPASKLHSSSSTVGDGSSKPPTTNGFSNANAKKIANSYKKFAIGNYAHMLLDQNDNNLNKKKVSSSSSSSDSDSDTNEEQIIDNYYESGQKNDRQGGHVATSQSGHDDLDKIATSINSHGKAKWKNSTKVTTKPNGPKHIRFSSTDSSTSTSSSSENEETEVNKAKTVNKQEQHAAHKETQAKMSNYYEPSKEEQLNAMSNNRTFVVKNTQDLSNFKKVFNQTKLNAPRAEEFAQEESNEQVKTQNGELKKMKKKKSEEEGRRSPSPPQSPTIKIDYSQFEALTGAPRVDDRIAFQILEISSNFTPEISDYKIGTVTEIDSNSNEVTLKLSSLYNSILKKPSKFSVVLEDDDETEEDVNGMNKGHQDVANEEEKEAEDMIMVDWRNLMNVKLVPQDKWPSPKAATHFS